VQARRENSNSRESKIFFIRGMTLLCQMKAADVFLPIPLSVSPLKGERFIYFSPFKGRIKVGMG
jgi:hypothetical protein